VIPWRPISELPDQLKDGRPVLLWVEWPTIAERYPALALDPQFQPQPVAGRWRSPGGQTVPDRGYWALTQSGGYAEDDEVSGEITHFAEIQAP
jgi:hypothetical protein